MSEWTAFSRIVGEDGIASDDIRELLVSLSEKNLIATDENGRSYLLESVRAYGRGMLGAAHDVEAARARHLEYFASLADEARLHNGEADQQEWLNRQEVEHENFRMALSYACETAPGGERRSIGRGFLIAGGIGWFWDIRGYLSEGRDWVARLLAEDAASVPLDSLARYAAKMGRISDAARLWSAAEECRRSIGVVRPTDEVEELQRAISAARTTMANDAESDRAWQEGRAMPLERAVELAMAIRVESSELWSETATKSGSASTSTLDHGSMRSGWFRPAVIHLVHPIHPSSTQPLRKHVVVRVPRRRLAGMEGDEDPPVRQVLEGRISAIVPFAIRRLQLQLKLPGASAVWAGADTAPAALQR